MSLINMNETRISENKNIINMEESLNNVTLTVPILTNEFPSKNILIENNTILSDYLFLCSSDMWLFYIIGNYFTINHNHSNSNSNANLSNDYSDTVIEMIATIWRKMLFLTNILYFIMGILILLWAILITNVSYVIWGLSIILQCLLIYPILKNIKHRFHKVMTFYEYYAIKKAISLSKIYVIFVLCSTIIYISTGIVTYFPKHSTVYTKLFMGILLAIPFGNAMISTWGLFFIILDVISTYYSIVHLIHMLDMNRNLNNSESYQHISILPLPCLEKMFLSPSLIPQPVSVEDSNTQLIENSNKNNNNHNKLTSSYYLEVYHEIKENNRESVLVCEYTTIVGYFGTIMCVLILFFPLNWENIIGACCIQIREIVLICIALPYISIVNETHSQFCELLLCCSNNWNQNMKDNKDMSITLPMENGGSVRDNSINSNIINEDSSSSSSNNNHNYAISIDMLRLHQIATLHKPLTIQLLGRVIKKIDLKTQIFALCIVVVGFVVSASIRHFVDS